ncbi:MAG: response regulator [Hyphomicrobiaceae bacterium]|nr:response regulator [Hyphomicrobiaceae bacterium]
MAKALKRITYVEDEPDIREVARIGLETLGSFDVDVCVDGTEAVRKAPGFRPDLILLDVMMPGMDGIETFKALRELPELQNTPIIFMTAKAQPSEVERYTALGCAGVIVKPFDPVTLPEQVQSIWNGQV